VEVVEKRGVTRTELEKTEDGNRTKFESLRSKQRQRGGGGRESETFRPYVGTSEVHIRYELVIGQLRRVALPRQALRELPARGIVLDKRAVVIQVPLRRCWVAREFGRVRPVLRRVDYVLVQREVVPAPVPESVAQYATVRAPGRLWLLRRGQREAWVAPLLWWGRERV